MEIYSQFSLLRTSVARTRMTEKTDYFKGKEAHDPTYWPIYNSPLLPNPTDDPDIRSYDGTLRTTLPEGESSLTSYMEKLKAAKVKKTGNEDVPFTGVVLFGQGSRFFSQFPRGLFTRTVANSLTDMRESYERQADDAIQHTFVPGDYYNESIRREVYNTVGGKADGTYLKAIAGNDAFPRNPFLSFRELQFIWSHTEDEGVIFVEILAELWPLVRPFVDRLNETDTIEAQTGYTNYLGDFLRLVRHADAPEMLPFLSRNEIRENLRRAIGTGRPFPL